MRPNNVYFLTEFYIECVSGRRVGHNKPFESKLNSKPANKGHPF